MPVQPEEVLVITIRAGLRREAQARIFEPGPAGAMYRLGRLGQRRSHDPSDLDGQIGQQPGAVFQSRLFSFFTRLL